MKRKAAFFVLYLFVPALVLWLVGLFLFSSKINTLPKDLDVSTEALVALTGGTDRLATAVELLKNGKAQKLLISGVNKNVDWSLLTKTVENLPDELSERITLGHSACNTEENALESKAWMEKNGFKSVRLVTAAYHMPRSLSEFKAAMPDADIRVYPVFTTSFKNTEWWKWRGSAALLISEYTKFLIVSVRHVLPFRTVRFDIGEGCFE